MGTNTLTTIIEGEGGVVAQVNQYKTALTGDILPRNAQGAPEDEAGSVGSSSVKIKDIHMTGNIYKGGTMVTKVFTSTGSWVCPEGVYEARVLCAGAGGRGAYYPAIVNTGNGGGGGGTLIVNVTTYPLLTYPVSVTSAASFNGDFVAGGGGNSTTVEVSGLGGVCSVSGLYLSLSLWHGGCGKVVPSQDPYAAAAVAAARGHSSYGANSGAYFVGGGGGYSVGGNGSGSGGGGGGGYLAASGLTGGAAGVEITYWLPVGVTDPN